MTHTLKFRQDVTVPASPPQGSRRVKTRPVRIRKGQTVSGVQTRPYVEDFVEKCDIALADGSELLGVPFAAFRFSE